MVSQSTHGHSPWSQSASLFPTLACLSPSDTSAKEPERFSFPAGEIKQFRAQTHPQTTCLFAGLEPHWPKAFLHHLSSVGELVDLRGGDAGNNQTHGHDGEAGQDLIPHGYSPLTVRRHTATLNDSQVAPKTALDCLFC